MEPVHVTSNPHEKAMQRALIQYRNPKNYDLVYEALMKAGRQDLIGFDKKCLIKPRKFGGAQNVNDMKKNSKKRNSADGNKVRNEKSSGNTRSVKNVEGGKSKKKTIRNVHKKK